jgi:DNA-directed RNA polymerase subunit alpha
VSEKKAWVRYETLEDYSGRFVVEPLERGMGNTLGNSIRRVLLSSLEGAAITSVNFEGISHEFSTIPNVVEDVLDIICNLKSVVFKADNSFEEKMVLKLEKKGKGPVTASDIEVSTGIEIVNKEQHIAELSDKGELKFNVTVEKGVGYYPSDIETSQDDNIEAIGVDASFSPILRVNHLVEKIRVGKSLDHDKLILDVWTDGSVDAEFAVQEASKILVDKFKLFQAINEEPEVEEDVSEEDTSKQNSALDMSIDDLELSARSSNCLKRAGIETVGSLVQKDMSELIQIKNFGKKSADEINDKLKQFNLVLKG